MSHFTDLTGCKWEIVVDVIEAARVKEMTGVNPLSLFDDNLAGYVRVAGDFAGAVDYLWAFVAEQAEAAKVSERDFARRLDGDVIEAGVAAIVDAVIAFYPEKKRAPIQQAMTKLEQVGDAMLAEASETISRLDASRLATDALNSLSSSADSSESSPSEG